VAGKRQWLVNDQVSQRRGHDLSPCESRLVELLGRP
jgi:hypothetical protein